MNGKFNRRWLILVLVLLAALVGLFVYLDTGTVKTKGAQSPIVKDSKGEVEIQIKLPKESDWGGPRKDF